MIISRTPYRVSFFGGGSDYPSWYRAHGGKVLATTIDKYCYLTCRYLPPFFEHRFRVVYSKCDTCRSIDEISHPAVREGLRYLQIDRGVEIHHDGDLPARSGAGTSSAFAVGLLHALHALEGRMVHKLQLAQEAIHLEQDILCETVGSQDQVLSAYGGLNQVTFHPTGEFTVRPVVLPPARRQALSDSLMLFYTGIRRTASDVADTYAHTLATRQRQVQSMVALVDEALEVLCGPGSLDDFGRLLHEAWALKSSLSARVTNGELESIYERARSAGALGGKLLGAGGGGFFLLYVPTDQQAAVRQELSELVHVPFDFEPNGSQIIFFDREREYPADDADATTRRSFRELKAQDDTAETRQ
ncbi:MAG: GHMP kinase [Pirellulales bacterium]|nr:GHMP kinase [Pirellulales bacterium]